MLNRLNVEHGLIISYEDLYIPEVNELLDLPNEYFHWLMTKSGQMGSGGDFRICDYPFVFDAAAKTQLLRADQQIQMYNARQQAHNNFVFNVMMMGNAQDPEGMQFLSLRVSRANLVHDTLIQAQSFNVDDLKKPLRVEFVGEAAEDAGGVTKEFFLLLMRELLDPKYGMFKTYDETRTIWFHPYCFEVSNLIFLNFRAHFM